MGFLGPRIRAEPGALPCDCGFVCFAALLVYSFVCFCVVCFYVLLSCVLLFVVLRCDRCDVSSVSIAVLGAGFVPCVFVFRFGLE